MTHYEILHPHECAQDKPEDDSVMKVYVRDSITSDDDGWVVYKKGIERIVAYMYVSHIGSRVLDVRFFAPQTDPGQDEAYELDPPDRWIKLDVSAYLASRKPTVKDLLIAELEAALDVRDRKLSDISNACKSAGCLDDEAMDEFIFKQKQRIAELEAPAFYNEFTKAIEDYRDGSGTIEQCVLSELLRKHCATVAAMQSLHTRQIGDVVLRSQDRQR